MADFNFVDFMQALTLLILFSWFCLEKQS